MFDLIPGLDIRPRGVLAETGLERRRREDTAADLNTGKDDIDVVVVREMGLITGSAKGSLLPPSHGRALGPDRDGGELHARFFLKRTLAGIDRGRRRE